MLFFNLTQLSRGLSFICLLSCIVTLSGCNKTANQQSVQPFNSSATDRSIKTKKLTPKKQSPMKTALLIPLTGQHSKLGTAIERATEMALFIKNVSNFDLAIYDTQSTATGAQDAFKKAMSDKCTAVIGPIFSDDIIAIKALARAQNIPIFSLSNNTAIADSNTFVLGLSPLDQAVCALDYAYQQNLTHILTILPQNQLGQEIAAKIKNMPADNKIIFYDPKQLSTLQNVIQEIQNGSINGLFIPEGGAALARISSALVYAEIDLKNIQLIGSSLWDEPATRNNPTLQNAWITVTDPVQYERFENEFKKNYAMTSPKIASIGYDAIALLITAKKHFDTKALMLTNITSERGYLGANGIFKLQANGFSKRTYSIMQLHDNKFIPIKSIKASTQ